MAGRQWPQVGPLLVVLLLLCLPRTYHSTPYYRETETEPTSATESTNELASQTSTDLLTESSSSTTTGTSESTTTTTTTTTTAAATTTTTISTIATTVPSLSDIDLFTETDTILGNITTSLDGLQQVVDGRVASPYGLQQVVDGRVASPYGLQQVVDGRVAGSNLQPTESSSSSSSNFCKTQSYSLCTDLHDTLDHTQYLVEVLVENTSTWDATKVQELRGNSQELSLLTEEVEKAGDVFLASVVITSFKEYITTTKDAVAKGRKMAQDTVDAIRRRERDSIIFVAVMGTVGGILMVIPLVGIGFVCYRNMQAKRASQGVTYRNNIGGRRLPEAGKHHQPPGVHYERSPAPRNSHFSSPRELKNDPYIRRPSSINGHFKSATTRADPYSRPVMSRQLGGTAGGLNRTSTFY